MTVLFENYITGKEVANELVEHGEELMNFFNTFIQNTPQDIAEEFAYYGEQARKTEIGDYLIELGTLLKKE